MIILSKVAGQQTLVIWCCVLHKQNAMLLRLRLMINTIESYLGVAVTVISTTMSISVTVSIASTYNSI